MKKRKRTSLIWTMPLCDITKIIKKSTSYREALKSLGFQSKGGNFRALKSRIKEDSIDDSHIRNRPNTFNANMFLKIPNDKLFVENSEHARNVVKRRIIKGHLVDHTICSECGMDNEWNGKLINFVLDHINGVPNDHRMTNLRFLCPNCNSQTKTFAGRNNKHKENPKRRCECGNKKWKLSKVCKKCSGLSLRKVDRPSKSQLKQDISEMSWVAMGKKYGVSDNACRKWARKMGLIT